MKNKLTEISKGFIGLKVNQVSAERCYLLSSREPQVHPVRPFEVSGSQSLTSLFLKTLVP
jgi:hypothetical protein